MKRFARRNRSLFNTLLVVSVLGGLFPGPALADQTLPRQAPTPTEVPAGAPKDTPMSQPTETATPTATAFPPTPTTTPTATPTPYQRPSFPESGIAPSFMQAATESTISTPIAVTPNDSMRPAIATDVQGNPHVVWSEHLSGQEWDIYYSRWDGTSWTGPFSVADTASLSARPHLAVDSAGLVHIVWEDDTDGRIYYSQGSDTSWSSPIPLSSGTGDYPKIRIDSTGKRHAVWDDKVGTWDILYASSTDGENWVTEWVPGSGHRRSSDMIVDDQDVVHVLWVEQQPARIGYAKRLATGWSGPELIFTGVCDFLSIAVDSTGQVHVSWAGEQDDIYYRRVGSDVENVSQDQNSDGWANSLLVNRDDVPHLAWATWREGPNREIFHAVKESRGWVPTNVSRHPSSDSWWPDAAEGKDGAIHVVWQDNEPGNWDIYYTREEEGPPLPCDQSWACESLSCSACQAQNQAGGPINTYSGNYNFQQQDISIATLGQSLRFERSYNSGAAELYTTTLGYGWTHNYDIDLVFPDDPGGEADTVILKAPLGSRLRFTDNDGTYSAWPGVQAAMTREGSDPYTYTITATNQTVYTFSGDEQVSRYMLDDDFESYGGHEVAQDPGAALYWLHLDSFESGWPTPTQGIPRYTTDYYVEGSKAYEVNGSGNGTGGEKSVNWDLSQDGRFADDDYVYIAIRPSSDFDFGQFGGYVFLFLHTNYKTDVYGKRLYSSDLTTGQWNFVRIKKSDFSIIEGSPTWSSITYIEVGTKGCTAGKCVFDDLRIVKADPGDSTVGNDTGSAWDFPSGQWHIYDDTGSYSLGQIDAQAGVEKVALVHEEPEADVEYRAAVQAKRDDGLVGLTFRMDDGSEGSEDGYAFLLDTASDQLALRSYAGGTPTDVTSTVSFSGALTDTWYYLGVRTEGDQIRAYASSITSTNLFTDTNLQFDVTDATHASGRAGLMTIGTLGRFDDVSLVESYEEPGHLVSVRDPQGNVTQFTYTDGRLSRVTEPTGQRYLDLSYDGQGRLAQISDPINRTVQYGYDANGDLGVVTDTRGLAWTMTYTGTHLLYEIVDPEGHTVERQEYDGQGRVTHQWDGLENELVLTYNADDTVTVTDPRGNVITDTYGTRHTLASQEDPLGNSPSYTYDADFNRTSVTDENDHTTYYEWEACCGLLSVITDTLGNATHMGYDGRNNLTSRTDALGRTTTYEYDGNNLIRTTDPLTGTVEYTYTVRGQVRSVTDENNHTTTYGYDGFGQRVAITDALGTVTWFGYDGVGRLITTTLAAGTPRQRVTVNEYDNGDNLVRVTENNLAGQPQNHLNEYNLVTEYAYDGAGNRTVVTDTLGVVTMNQYDAANRLMRTIENYDLAKAQNEDDVYNIVTEYGYDEAGNQVTVTDTLARVTRTEYDELNRPITVTVNYVQGGPVDEETNVTTLYGYDAVGNRITVTDALGRVTRTEPDALNRPVTVTANYVGGGPVDDETNVATVYAYDKVGNQTTVTDALGRVTRTDYDELNRPITVTVNYINGGYDPAHPDEDVATEYAYDPAGNRIQITDPVSRITRYEYDDLNRPVTVTLNYVQGGPVDEETNVATVYGYDELAHPGGGRQRSPHGL